MRLYTVVVICLCLCCKAPNTEDPEEATPDPRKKTYLKYCMSCHGASGTMGFSGSANLTLSSMSRDSVIEMIKEGKNAMLPLEDVMTPEEIKEVADYVMTIRKAKKE